MISDACKLALVLASVTAATGDEAAICAEMRSYFASPDPAHQQAAVERILADTAYDRAKVSEWLNDAVAFPEIAERGDALHHERVRLKDGDEREITIRVPENYDATKPWPLIYALHGAGGNGPDIIAYVAQLLGPRVNDYLIAAPEGYQQFVIHEPGPSDEHLRVLAHLHRRLHLDSNRVYCTGYSRGGHATWTLSVLHADQFAGSLSLAGTFYLLGVDALWPPFLPNLQNLPLIHVWGENDVIGDGGEESPQDGINGVSRMLREQTAKLDLLITHVELAGVGHGGVRPAPALVDQWLSARRPTAPRAVEHVFRWPYQASAYWIEGHEWKGKMWDDSQFTVSMRVGEAPLDAYHRELRARLARLSGKIDGNVIDVRRDQIGELTIWITDDMIDWAAPVTVKVSGRVVFEGRLSPSLDVCLAEAARSYDLQRLRWAGVRFQSGRKAKVIGEIRNGD